MRSRAQCEHHRPPIHTSYTIMHLPTHEFLLRPQIWRLSDSGARSTGKCEDGGGLSETCKLKPTSQSYRGRDECQIPKFPLCPLPDTRILLRSENALSGGCSHNTFDLPKLFSCRFRGIYLSPGVAECRLNAICHEDFDTVHFPILRVHHAGFSVH